jgi:hypothetical protein
MERDTYQQRRLEAALVRAGIATAWRQYLSDAHRRRVPAADLAQHVRELGVRVDQRTLARWARQARQELEKVQPPDT